MAARGALVLGGILFAATSVGCMAAGAPFQQAPPIQDDGYVYLYRISEGRGLGYAISKLSVRVDENEPYQLAPDGFVVGKVPPGKHTIIHEILFNDLNGNATANRYQVDVFVERGRSYFFRAEFTGPPYPRGKILRVPEDKALGELAKTRSCVP
jgi:hypothetical protein